MFERWMKFGVSKARASVDDIGEKTLEEIRESIATDVAGGFRPEDEIVEQGAEYLADLARDNGDGKFDAEELKPVIQRILAEELEKHRAAQAGWPERTDCDLLDEAFEKLERNGIVSRQDFSCCGTCGAAEISDEMDAAERDGLVVRGYTFYHMQDTESAVEGGGLYLNYGATEEGTEASVAIGHEIAETLRGHGLKVTWDGDLGKRIQVEMDWKRRR